jgi:hypothetical protein
MSGAPLSQTAIPPGVQTPDLASDSDMDVEENEKRQREEPSEQDISYEDPFEDEEIDIDSIQVDTSDLIDNSVKILPGVRRMIDSIPKGRYAVATSGYDSLGLCSMFPN